MQDAARQVPYLAQLPDYGPLEINDLEEFLNQSKKTMAQKFSAKDNVDTKNFNFSDLIHERTIGIGSFGTVLLMKDQNKHYAVKVIDKKYIVRTNQIDHILNEKKILSVMNFPFIVYLVYFFLDNSYLYFVLPFIAGGDLFSYLRQRGKFEEGLSRFYTAQVVLAVEYLHFLDLIYRDLKPENILLDHTGYIKLTDFGFGKCLKSRTWTLCGTPEYLAPEMIQNKGYGKSVDWWAVGVFTFEMLCGRSPFWAKDQDKVYKKILLGRYVFSHETSEDSKDLIRKLLQPNTSLRLGTLKNGVKDIKEHQWFRPIDWMAVLNRKMDPPFVPEASEPGANFENYKDLTLKISATERFSKEFEHF